MSQIHPIRYLVLWPTAACDLDCLYCYRCVRSAGEMSRHTADQALDLAFSSTRENGLPLHVQLAGGEPLLAPQIVEHVAKRVHESGLPAQCAIQTNATHVDADTAAMLARLKVQVGVSLDGPPDIQERVRGGSAQTIQGMTELTRADIPVRVTSVLSSFNASRLAELTLTLAVFPNVRGFGLDPLVRLGSAAGRTDLDAADEDIISGITSLHCTLAQINRRRSRPLLWRELASVRASLNKRVHERPHTNYCARYCFAVSGTSLAVSASGAVFSCSQSVGMRQSRAGTITSIDWSVLENRFAHTVLRGPCESCLLNQRCPGDCPSRIETWQRHGDPMRTPAICLIYSTLARLEEHACRRSPTTPLPAATSPCSHRPPTDCQPAPEATASSLAPKDS